jgi:hypothetical protein
MTRTTHTTQLATVLLLLVTVSTARAQTISALADVSKETHRGDTLRVQHMDGRQTTGDLRDISTDGVLLDVDGTLVTIPAAEIRELGVTSDSFKNGALIGLATGAGVGMFAAATSGSSGDGLVDAATAGPAALIGLVAGGAAGVGIGIGLDALVRRYRVLYKAPVQVTPIMTSSNGYGMAFRVSW